jgi:hypothetical protein
MHPLDAACSRWEAAQRSLVIAEMVFAKAVHMYLIQCGCDPSDDAAVGLYEARLQSAHALSELQLTLEECRRSVRKL